LQLASPLRKLTCRMGSQCYLPPREVAFCLCPTN